VSDTATGSLTRAEVEDLLYREARLLDERRYEEWLDLLTEDIRYWIPSWDSEQVLVDDVTTDISLLYYERPTLLDYVARTQSGDAHVLDPAPRTDRYITNVIIADADAGIVQAKWLLHQFRRRAQDIFGGDIEYTVRREDDVLRIARKKVVLTNSSLDRGYLPVV
jgi:3-phenylpropionate/cinnamic acid dioxygenase small subunit